MQAQLDGRIAGQMAKDGRHNTLSPSAQGSNLPKWPTRPNLRPRQLYSVHGATYSPRQSDRPTRCAARERLEHCYHCWPCGRFCIKIAAPIIFLIIMD